VISDQLDAAVPSPRRDLESGPSRVRSATQAMKIRSARAGGSPKTIIGDCAATSSVLPLLGLERQLQHFPEQITKIDFAVPMAVPRPLYPMSIEGKWIVSGRSCKRETGSQAR
jgi:hypothetical protein